MTSTRYFIISPVRNEEKYLQGTISSVVSQTIRPTAWILVDDGSTDRSGQVIEEAARRHHWILAVRRPDRGCRWAGGGVMEAFHDGIKLIGEQRWQYLVKLDGDVSFGPDYFAQCFTRFAAEPRLGIGGGLICSSINGTLCPESKVDPPFHVRGATKIYRYECWQAIGGLVKATGWDTLDELKANMVGWTTLTFPEIQVIHHRPAGQAYGAWRNWVKNGYANYSSGYHPLFMLVKCAKRVLERPYGVGALGLMVGFCCGYLKRAWRVPDRDLIRYLRRQQMRRLVGLPSLWR